MLAETIGHRIKAVRGAISQDEFARRLSVHKETLGNYERNKRQPDAAFLIALRKEFGVSADWLLTGEAPPPSPAAEPPAPAWRLTKEAKELIAACAKVIEMKINERNKVADISQKVMMALNMYEDEMDLRADEALPAKGEKPRGDKSEGLDNRHHP